MPVNFNFNNFNYIKFMKTSFGNFAYYLGPVNLFFWIVAFFVFTKNQPLFMLIGFGVTGYFAQTGVNYLAVIVKQNNFEENVKQTLFTSCIITILFFAITFFTDKSMISFCAYTVGGAVFNCVKNLHSEGFFKN